MVDGIHLARGVGDGARIANVRANQLKARTVLAAQPFRVLFRAAPRQVIECNNALTARQQPIHPVTTDETTTAGDKNFFQG
jgi:hypothetical protein